MHEEIPKTPLRFAWFVTKPHIMTGIIVVLLVTLGEILSSGTPYLFKKIVDNAELGEVAGVMFWALLYPAVIGINYVLFRVGGYINAHWMTKNDAFGYSQLFNHLIQHSDTFFSNNFAGALSSRVTRGAGGTAATMDQLIWNWYTTTLQAIVSLILIVATNIWIGLLFFLLSISLVAVNVRLAKWRRPAVVTYSKSESELAGHTVDVATNVKAVHQFARKLFEIDLVKEVIAKRTHADLKQLKIQEWIRSINNVFVVVILFATTFLTVSLWGNHTITTGDLVMVFTLFAGMLGTFNAIGNMMNGFIRRYGEVQEALEKILEPHNLIDHKGAGQLIVHDGAISFEKVTFHYKEERGKELVFENLQLRISGNQKVGLVGHSGAGKTTLVSLLLRGHDVTGGSIAIDGQDIRDVTQESLRSNIAIVPQEPLLFHRSIKENIRYGKLEATDKEVVEAATLAQAHDFITAAPEGYDTYVGERGIKLSGGERQRIAIARAILKNAPILLLDEATSSLDSESEVLIQRALHELMQGKTVIAIAHRLSTLREMDRIIVLESGNIVQDGTHNELSQQEGVYKRLWDHQVGGFLQEE